MISDNLPLTLRKWAKTASEGSLQTTKYITAALLCRAADEIEALQAQVKAKNKRHPATEERKRAEKAEAEVERLRADLAELKVTNCTGLLGIRISE